MGWRRWVLAFVGLVPLLAIGAGVRLAWDPNPRPGAGYVVYYGGEAGTYTNAQDAGAELGTAIGGLKSGANYFFAMAAYDPATRMESDFSEETVAREVVATVVLESAPTVTGPWGQRGSLSVTGWTSGGEFFRGRMVVR